LADLVISSKNKKLKSVVIAKEGCDELASFLLRVYKKKKATEKKTIVEAGEN